MMNFTRLMTAICLAALAGQAQTYAMDDETVIKPAIMDKADIAGDIFSRPDMTTTEHPGGATYDVTSLLSSDEKFTSGMYRAGASRFEINESYGVDEFMYFLEGGVTLTSSDGSVQVIQAGDAVTIPKEWTGVWETQGYTKIWVIYSATGKIE